MACPLDKRSGKQGSKGLRLIRLSDPVGMAWFAATMGRGPAKDTDLDFAHGSVPNRSRESALMIQQARTWQTKDFRISTELALCDATNAFCCASIVDLDKVSKEMALR